RDAGLPLACQALIYPALDLTADSASYRRVVADAPLTAATMHYFIRHYTPDPAQRLDWRASPLRAPALAGLPPTLVFTVAHDPLCDEGRAYAQRLDAAGVRVHAVHCNDQTHGLLGQGRFVPAADSVGDSLFRWIGDALHRVAARAPAFSTPAADGRQQQPQETS
ncbi:MAG: alpha/beta hydrolase fold domain-containing protein, partial [Rhodoferax sp.]|nr:alpha/beta hydrolase fold domain-containing protein [Rhodoferax sp.]